MQKDARKQLAAKGVTLVGAFLLGWSANGAAARAATEVATVLPDEIQIEETVDGAFKTDSEATQLLLVAVADAARGEAVVAGYVKATDANADGKSVWKKDLADAPATIGRNGLAAPGEKREGDGKTPSGEFPLGFAFGRAVNAPNGVAIPYRQATENDYWIDDPKSPNYNAWITGEKPSVSCERLRLGDGPRARCYDWAVVVEYNFAPIVPGAGSAIFLHVWADPTTPTSGCVALSAENVLNILRWLDPDKKPRIRIEKRNNVADENW